MENVSGIEKENVAHTDDEIETGYCYLEWLSSEWTSKSHLLNPKRTIADHFLSRKWLN